MKVLATCEPATGAAASTSILLLLLPLLVANPNKAALSTCIRVLVVEALKSSSIESVICECRGGKARVGELKDALVCVDCGWTNSVALLCRVQMVQSAQMQDRSGCGWAS